MNTTTLEVRPSSVNLDGQTIPVITCHNQCVLTTGMLAVLYGTETNNIKVNLSRNKARFQEGVHFFKIVGAELRNL